MTSFLQILPFAQETSPESLVPSIMETLAAPLSVGSQEAVSYCGELSSRLVGDPRVRSYPALAALGFWLRPGAVVSMIQDYLSAPEASLRAPRGVVLQLAPQNPDTLFGYTSALSLLAGNVTLVRLLASPSPEQELLLSIMRDILSFASEPVRRRMLVFRYDADDIATSALSALCDARMVWGDDETVAHARAIPLPSLAREACFADRFSAAAFSATRYAALSQPEKQQIVRAFYNDIYIFDQMAGASPRLVVWVGAQEEAAAAASDFYPRLADHAAEHYAHPGVSEHLGKAGARALAARGMGQAVMTTYNAALTVMSMNKWKDLSAYKSLKFGYGFLLSGRIEKLRDLAVYAERRDQTLAVWGFGPDEVHAFVAQCGGRGFDRVVPVGQALSLGPIWDGTNLFNVLTRLVEVTV